MKEGLMQVAVDAVVFTIIKGELSILLIRRKYPPFQGSYALPGGFVGEKEEVYDAARRELAEETNVQHVFLKQLHAYGKVGRDPRGRVVSIAYLALINALQELKSTTDAAEAQWFSVDDMPKLAFDHARIIEDALHELRFELQTTNIALQILPKHFTLSQLQGLYEQILTKPLDKRNFRKRIKELGILKEAKGTWMEGAHRPAQLYEFVNQEYKPMREKIHIFL